MATYDFTPVNGGANVVGTLETTGALAMYIITVKDDSNTAVDLRDEDGVHGSLYDLILREVAPLMAFAPDGATGVIHVVVDSSANSAATLQARIRQLASATPADNDSTVAAGASFVIS
jgi:hypothetical protein